MTGTAVAFGPGTGLATREDLAAGLNNAAMSIPSIGGDKQFLKMDKGNGEWIYGQEEILVEADALIALNPFSLRHGWIAWHDSKPESEIMVSALTQPLPGKNTLPAVQAENGWQQQVSVDGAIINGQDEGTQLQYKQSSIGAMKAFSALINAIGTQLKKDPDKLVPIVRLKSDPYKHKDWGRIYNPILEIVEWRTMDDGSAPATEPAPETRTDTAPATQQRAPRQRPSTDQLTEAAAAAPGAQMTAEEEEAALAAEYQQEQAAQTANPAPRRRTRR